MATKKEKDRENREKNERRLEHIEQQSQDFGRYGRNPKEIPPKRLTPTETMQSQEEIMEEEIKQKMTEKTHGTMVRDAVCGKMINPDSSEFHATADQQKYSFCSQKCLEAFKKSPEDYIKF